MRMVVNFFKFLLCFIFLIPVQGCSRIKDTFSSMRVTCTSYDGSSQFYVIAEGKNGRQRYAGLTSFGVYSLDASSIGDAEYVDSVRYDNAESIVSYKKGVRLTLMPDKLHGMVDVWKNREGESIKEVSFPVLCFKDFRK